MHAVKTVLLYFHRGHRNGKIVQNGTAESDSLQVDNIYDEILYNHELMYE